MRVLTTGRVNVQWRGKARQERTLQNINRGGWSGTNKRIKCPRNAMKKEEDMNQDI